MGLGIAYVASVKARLPVLIHDKSKDQIEKSLKLMDALLAKDVKKGKLQQADATEARERVTVVNSIAGLRDVDMCIEVRFLECLQLQRWRQRVDDEMVHRLRLRIGTSSLNFLVPWPRSSGLMPYWHRIPRQ